MQHVIHNSSFSNIELMAAMTRLSVVKIKSVYNGWDGAKLHL